MKHHITAAACMGALAITLTACGGSSSGASALTGDQMVSKAVANLKSASSVEFQGSVGSQSMTVDVARGKGCTVKGGSGADSNLIVKGKDVWTETGQGEWMHDGTGQTQDASSACDLDSLTSDISQATGIKKGSTSVISGQQVVALTDAGNTATLYVTNTASPQLVQLKSSGESITFSHYNTPVTLAPPKGAKVTEMPQL